MNELRTCSTPDCMNLYVHYSNRSRVCSWGCAKRAKSRPRNCSLCGGLRDHVRTGPVYCSACRAARRAVAKRRRRFLCGACLSAPAATGRGPALCQKCRESCQMCGGPRELHFRLCKACKPEYDRLERERNRDQSRERNRQKAVCRHCGRKGAFRGYCDECKKLCKRCFKHRVEGATYCLECRRARSRLQYRKDQGIPVDELGRTDCLECGADTRPSGGHATIAVHVKFCSRNCRYRYKTRRRRAARKKVRHVDFSRLDILERDGWMCQLCNKRIDRRLKFPHPKSASLDHIVPLSVGGADVPSNVQAAHWDCNVAKGNRPANDQLRLVG